VRSIGQIEFRNQYSLKRNYLNRQEFDNRYSLLSDTGYNHVSFKGLNFYAKLLKPTVKVVPQNLTDKVFNSLKNISKEQFATYNKIKADYINFIKNNPAYRKKNGISDDILKKLVDSDGSVLIYLPQKTVLNRFVEQLFSPVTSLYKWGKKIVLPKNSHSLVKAKEEEVILKKYAALDGLIKSHEIWENGYRKMLGHPKLSADSHFLIPDDVLYSKMNRRRNKVVDPNRGKYSSNSLMIGNRLISGIIYSYFLGTDAYNTTMRYSNNKEEASLQRNSRVAQEFSRIGMNMYIQNLLFGTFEAAVNKSLPTAMFVSGSTVACSEILGRKLVGKPIMPSNKEELDRREKEMANKKGLLPAIGRLLTNVKKKDNVSKPIQNTANISVFDNKNKANSKLFSAFSKKEDVSPTVSFKGAMNLNKFFKVENLIEKDLLANVHKIVENADVNIARNIEDVVMKSVAKSPYFKDHSIPTPTTFKELLSNNSIKKIPLGEKDTLWGKFVESVLVPVKFLKNLYKSSVGIVKKIYYKLTGKVNNQLLDELNTLKSAKDAKSLKRLAKFEEFYKNRLKLEAWATSKYSDDDKLLKIFAEFKSIKYKDKEDIQGVKNILLWLDKQITKEGIKIEKDGTLSKENLQKVKDILMDSVLRADGQKQLEYDGNALAQTNINLSRAITTLFLVTDAYNLTMQYSNNNKKDASKSAKNRAAQEVSRIGVSAYMMAFVHNLLSKLCNSSLGGAFTLTALTSTINDSLSREVVGVPLTAKTQEQLEAIDKKNGASKNPIKKALAYSIGKKSVAAGLKAKQKTSTVTANQSFLNDFFITPHIS